MYSRIPDRLGRITCACPRRGAMAKDLPERVASGIRKEDSKANLCEGPRPVCEAGTQLVARVARRSTLAGNADSCGMALGETARSHEAIWFMHA